MEFIFLNLCQKRFWKFPLLENLEEAIFEVFIKTDDITSNNFKFMVVLVRFKHLPNKEYNVA